MKFFKHLCNVIKLFQLDPRKRKLVFYSEGKDYWVHLEGLISEVLEQGKNVCYISSDPSDPGLIPKSDKHHPFLIDSGGIRNWLFENIDCDVMVMTMPDLHQFQVKRSRHNVHYVYVQHSLVSLHMVYRKGAFDHFDTLFCSGPHHEIEARAIEATYAQKPKKLIKHGYGRLDSILKNAAKNTTSSATQPLTVLVAPSWGPSCIIETIGPELITKLLDLDIHVILRPHPQTVKLSANKIQAINDVAKNNPKFSIDDDVSSQTSLLRADIMISDWSGAALDFGFGLCKPVLFIDVERKVNNPDYRDVAVSPFEETIRDKIGCVLQKNNLASIGNKIIELTSSPRTVDYSKYVYNIGESDKAGAEALITLLKECDNHEK